MRRYVELHAALGRKEQALKPLVRDNPACARYLAEGALMRLICGERCFEAYRGYLWASGG